MRNRERGDAFAGVTLWLMIATWYFLVGTGRMLLVEVHHCITQTVLRFAAVGDIWL